MSAFNFQIQAKVDLRLLNQNNIYAIISNSKSLIFKNPTSCFSIRNQNIGHSLLVMRYCPKQGKKKPMSVRIYSRAYPTPVGRIPHYFQSCGPLVQVYNPYTTIGRQAIVLAALFRTRSLRLLCAHTENSIVNNLINS